MKNRSVTLSICSECSTDTDLMDGMKEWPRAFESFVLTTQLRSYEVTVKHVQIGTMNILGGFEKSTAIKTLVNDNKSVLKSLKTPANIEDFAEQEGYRSQANRVYISHDHIFHCPAG